MARRFFTPFFRRRIPGSFSRAGALLVLVLMLFAGVFAVIRPDSTSAAASTTLTFQARLLNTSGSLVADGTYNVEFKIYDTVGSGASAQGVCSLDSSTDDCWWLETRTGANKVSVKNGYIYANLGSVTAFSSTIPWDQELWITMNIGGTGAPSWDGEMSPRFKVAAVPYAFAAQKLQVTDSAITNKLVFATPSASNKTITLPNETGTVCTTGSVCSGYQAAGSYALTALSNLSGVAINTALLPGADNTIDLGSATFSFRTLYGDTSVITPLLTSTAGLAVTGGTTLTLASTGAGNDVIINGADILDVQDNATFAGTLTVTSTATFNGVTAIGDAVTDNLTVLSAIQGANALIFDGATDNTNEITLAITDPGADFTITLPAQTGTVCTTGSVCSGYQASGSYALTALSNLSSVAINTSLLPASDDTIDLGDNTHRFRDLYLGGETLHIGTSTSDEGAFAYTTSTNVLSATSTGGMSFTAGSTGDYVFNTDADTNFGIGVATPLYNLHVRTATDDNLAVRDGSLFGGLTGVALQSVNDADNTYRHLNLEGSTVTFNVASGGSVGVGIGAPLKKLDVAGSGRLTGTATSVLTGSINPTASTTLTGVGTLFLTQLVVGDRITVSGETRTVVAIASDTSLTVDTATTDTANDTSPDKLAAILVVRDSSNAVKVVVNDLGNVGLGTSAPTVKLDILAVDASGLNILSGNSSNFTALGIGRAGVEGQLGIASSSGLFSNIAVAGDVIFRNTSNNLILGAVNATGGVIITTGATDTAKLTVINNGNVGIATTPSTTGAKLQVVGSVSATTGIVLNATGNSNSTITKSTVVTTAVTINDVVVIDTANAGQVKTTTTGGSTGVFGIATSTQGSTGQTQDIVIGGIYQVTADLAAVAIGDQLITSTTAGQVTPASSPSIGQSVGRALSAKSAGSSGLIWVQVTPGAGGHSVNDSNAIGSITTYGGSTAPIGWLMADGTAVSRTTYAELFAAIGTTYGAGDGSSTFNLPDFRGRGAVGSGTGIFTGTISSVNTSTEEITLTSNNSLYTGAAVYYDTTSGAIGGLTDATTYYAIRVSATVVKLATSRANAVALTAINLTSGGSGTQTLAMSLTNLALGSIGGEDVHSLLTAELPVTDVIQDAHDHNTYVGWGAGSGAYPLWDGASNDALYGLGNLGNTTTANNQPFGSSTAFTTLNPYTTVNYIIRATTGVVNTANGSGPQSAKLRRDASQTGILTATVTKVAFDAEEYDVGDIADYTTNDRFLIKKAGKYLITTGWRLPAVVDNTESIKVFIYKNGTAVAEREAYSSIAGGYPSVAATDTLDLVANDYIEMYVAQYTGATQSTSTAVGDRPTMSVVQLDTSGNATTLQGAYDMGRLISTTDARDLTITLTDTTTDSNFLVNVASGSTSKFGVQYNGSDTFSISNAASAQGSALFKNATNNTTAFVIQNATAVPLVTVDTTNKKLTVATDIVATSAATAGGGSTYSTTVGATTNTTSVTVAATTNLAVNDIILINNAGQDYYTRITNIASLVLTVSPAVSVDANSGSTPTVVEHTIQNIGATTADYATNANKFFQGYFLGGVVTGAGSTTLSDGNLSSTGNLVLQSTSGNVGIGTGTAAPATKLHILGAGSAGTVVEALRLDNSEGAFGAGAGTGLGFYYTNSGKHFGSINTLAYAGDGGKSDMTFSVRTAEAISEKMRILSNGNVGIGDTSPASLFTVGSGDLFQVGSGGNLTIASTSGTGINISNTGITTDISFQNGETIDNNVDGTIAVTGNITISGTSKLGTSGTAFTGIRSCTYTWDPASTASGATTVVDVEMGVSGGCSGAATDAVILSVAIPTITGFASCDIFGCFYEAGGIGNSTVAAGSFRALGGSQLNPAMRLSFINGSSGTKDPSSAGWTIWYLDP